MKFKAGKYYVGDLCYVVKEYSDWMKLLEDTNYFQNENQSYKGYPIFAESTAYGDGVYYDQDDREYSVDATCVAFVNKYNLNIGDKCYIKINGNIFGNSYVEEKIRNLIGVNLSDEAEKYLIQYPKLRLEFVPARM